MEFLVHRGHLLNSILWEYTIDQVMLFYKVGQDNVRREFLDEAFAVRFGVNADDKQWKNFLMMMSPRIKNNKPRPFTKTDAARLDRLLRGK